jgi:predicted ATPase/DNA-binding winged helix-turn-helix (wHTH) protein
MNPAHPALRHTVVMTEDGVLRFGRFTLDLQRRVLLVDGQPARLGPRAVELLRVLASQRRRVVAKDELFDRVWPGVVVEENNLQQQISALRKLLGPEAIVTVPGRGYKFTLQPDDEATPVPCNLPAPVDEALPAAARVPDPGPLVGREADLAELRARLAAQGLVTVVGPGGVGKTRLAWAAARADGGRYDDGVWVVELAALARGAPVAPLVAQALGVELPVADAVDAASAVAAALRRQHLLLLLDNGEHLLEGVASLVVALQRQAPRVHVLVTSQEPLRLPGEQVLRLSPLATAAAADLFIARARAADRRFAATVDDRAEVARICARLAGLPLAIELAAARVPLLGLRGLREQLDDDLRVLASGPAHAPARQQTLRAALAWSHDLLDDAERRLFRRLAVFSGGCSLELAQQVLVDAGLDRWTVLDQLGALVDKSLLVADPEPAPRLRLLEPARAFALERLHASGEAPALRLRHAQAMAAMLQAFDAAVVHEPRYDRLLRPLQAEADNLRAAMRWVVTVADGSADDAPLAVPAARRLAITLAAHADWLWIEGDVDGEGWRFCALAREWLDGEVPAPLACRLRLSYQGQARARALPAAAWIDDARAAVQGWRALGDRVGLYRALCPLGGAPRSVISDAEAGALLAEAEALEDAAWSPRLRMRRQVSLEWWHDLGGRLQECRQAGLRYLALARAAGSVRAEIGSLGNLADTELALGHLDEAIARSREAIALAAAHGMPAAASHAYANMVPALLERGELQSAEDAIRQGRRLQVRSIGSALELLLPAALLAWRRGEPLLAAQLLGCAERAYAERGDEPHPPERRMRDTLLAGLEAGLPAPVLSALRREGAAWDEDEGYARAGLD